METSLDESMRACFPALLPMLNTVTNKLVEITTGRSSLPFYIQLHYKHQKRRDLSLCLSDTDSQISRFKATMNLCPWWQNVRSSKWTRERLCSTRLSPPSKFCFAGDQQHVWMTFVMSAQGWAHARPCTWSLCPVHLVWRESFPT